MGKRMQSVFPERIETERLLLRPYQAGDGEMYYAVSRKNRAHLQRYESDNVLMEIDSVDEAETIVREIAAEWENQNCYFVGVFDKTEGEFLAQVFVGYKDRDLPDFIIGYIADVEQEGRGYVAEAVRAVLPVLFRNLGAHRVTIHMDDTNVRSQRVAERCGFNLEGHIRENKLNEDGSYSGTLRYGMLRGEFEELFS